MTKTDEMYEVMQGIFIVVSKDEKEVELRKFYSLIRDENPIPTMKIEKIKNPVGSDGKEVTFERGDLLMVTPKPRADGKMSFHFANVGPSEEKGYLQYAVALHKIGMGEMPQTLDKNFLVVDGNFRKVN